MPIPSSKEGPELPQQIDKNGNLWREIRCENCHKLLGHEYVREGRLLLKCGRCGRISLLEFKPPKKAQENHSNDKNIKGG